jgi:hypothetical protein
MCKDEVYDYHISIGNEPLECGMEMVCATPDDGLNFPVLSKEKCCENKFLTFDNSEQLEPSAAKLVMSNIPVVIDQNFKISGSVSPIALKYLNQTYLPPNIDSDIQLEIQQFLI